MEQSSPKSGQLSLKSGQLSHDASERVVAFLRGRHPHRTADEVAAATRGRVPAETVRGWIRRASAPSWQAGLALVAAYGPEFLAAALGDAPGWLDAAARAEKLAALEAEQARVAAEILSLGRAQ